MQFLADILIGNWPRSGLRAGMLFATFVGAGLYLRGFYLYFYTLWWLRQPGQEAIRRKYKSSVLAAAFREPELRGVKVGLILAAVGVPLFALGGLTFNAMRG